MELVQHEPFLNSEFCVTHRHYFLPCIFILLPCIIHCNCNSPHISGKYFLIHYITYFWDR